MKKTKQKNTPSGSTCSRHFRNSHWRLALFRFVSFCFVSSHSFHLHHFISFVSSYLPMPATDAEKAQIISLVISGDSEATIMRKLNLPRKKVRYWRSHFLATGSSASKRRMRRKKTTPAICEKIKQLTLANRRAGLSTIAEAIRHELDRKSVV